MTIEAQRALHDRANLQHQLAFTLSRVNAEREEREASQATGTEDGGGGGDEGEEGSESAEGVSDGNSWKDKKSSELEELKWKKETAELEVGKLREEMEMICRDRDEGKSLLKMKMLENIEAQAKCESLKEQREESEKKLTSATETGRMGGVCVCACVCACVFVRYLACHSLLY